MKLETMNKFSLISLLLAAIFLTACDSDKQQIEVKTSQPEIVKENLSDEQLKIKKEYSKFKTDFSKAMNTKGHYVQIAVKNRQQIFKNEEYSAVLILVRDLADLDDFAFSLPGKEASEKESDYVDAVLNEEAIFWVDIEGNIYFDDKHKFNKHLVVEWWISNKAGDKVSMHFGGDHCLNIDLSKK